MNWVWPGFIGGFIVALITVFKKEWSPITVPIYAVLEGLTSGISYWYATSEYISEQLVRETGILYQLQYC